MWPTVPASTVNNGVPFLYSGLTHTADNLQWLLWNSSGQVLPQNTFQGIYSPLVTGQWNPFSVYTQPFTPMAWSGLPSWQPAGFGATNPMLMAQQPNFGIQPQGFGFQQQQGFGMQMPGMVPMGTPGFIV
ncbi:MAG: hypothetical protein SFZ03_07410 [Candidatus Melainabacteria bacterium]|nr:hypothetical protein [Candidatus Melainabacteria bacterium]